MQKKVPQLQKISTLIWKSQYDELRKIADEEDKKIATMIRRAIDNYLRQNTSNKTLFSCNKEHPDIQSG